MAKRTRSKGEGSISQRRDGRWLGQVTLGRDGNGKRIRRSVVADTKREVLERLHELREAKRRGALTAASKLTVATYLDEWLEQKKSEVARRTHASYADLARLHIQTTALAGVRLQAVTPLHVQAWLGELERRGLSPRRRADARQVLRTAFEAAVNLGLVAQNPVARVKAPKVVVGERRWLTSDEVKRLLQAAATEPPSVRAFVLLLVTTGVRYGEIAGLTWGGVDLATGTITISQALKEVNGERFIEEPKSRAARRTIAIPPVAVDALRDLRCGTTPLPKTLVFTAVNGAPLRRSNVLRRVWHPLLKRAKVTPCGFHATRRAHVTALVAAGADVRSVSARVGHSKVALTLDTYAQVASDADRRLAALAGGLLANESA